MIWVALYICIWIVHDACYVSLRYDKGNVCLNLVIYIGLSMLCTILVRIKYILKMPLF